MTQQEFDDRMGKESTLEEYASAENRKNQIYAFVKLLLNAASTYEDNSILMEVSKILGMDEYIRLCLSEDIPLTKVDRDYILSHLR